MSKSIDPAKFESQKSAVKDILKRRKSRKKKSRKITLFGSGKSSSKNQPSLLDLRQSNTNFSNKFKKSFQKIEEMEKEHKSK